MSSLKKIICLANSYKLNERCIAGIDLDTGKWIRPVCDRQYPEDGRVPKRIRFVEGREPKPLDILEIPLDNKGNDFGFESENLSVLKGEWKCLGQAKVEEILKYCNNSDYILHNSRKYVNPSYLKTVPFHRRRTIEIVKVKKQNFSVSRNEEGKFRGSIKNNNGYLLLNNAKITDPEFIKDLENRSSLTSNNLLVTISLSMPYAPSPNWEGEPPCWKLIANIIEF
ncbi:MAG: hypothetical protein F6K18_30245 [Okeania sp. SIO2C2]|uniref:dual OB domain-containing protein n=1 Tax=Okeania sp. SIO2C2 TaxID=2607787 RepID=UPI0013BC64AD|nr:hypothetical protein [Okeania sp. SIO2C2]NEP90748.1 hypothetical protein [Okeania sp. SIO2C2]